MVKTTKAAATKIKAITSLADLLPDRTNLNKHSQRGGGMAAQSVRECGMGRSIVVDKAGRIIGGNQIVETAGELDMMEVEVVQSDGRKLVVVQRTDLDLEHDERARKLSIFDNRVAEVNLDWDATALQELQAQDFDLSGFWRDDELAALLAGAENGNGTGGGGEEAPPAVPSQTRVQVGDIWQCGRHRIGCLDCTDAVSLERLLDGAKPALLHTDPPYGINIVSPKGLAAADLSGGSKPFGATSGTARRSSSGFDARPPGGAGKKTVPPTVPVGGTGIIQSNVYPVIQGDDRPFEPGFLLDMAPLVILWGANYYAGKLPQSPCWICWDKREDITRNNFADGELAWCSKSGPMRIFHHLWNGLHKGSQHNERRTHPTEKPIALFEEIGRMFCPAGVWLDLYCGTGAQLIAAERMGPDVTFIGCDIEPIYVDVALRRIEAEAGQTAQLLDRLATPGPGAG